MRRRDFLLAGSVVALGACARPGPPVSGRRLSPSENLGGIRTEDGAAPIEGATWYVAGKTGDGVRYTFPAGALAQVRYLTADFLLDGNHMAAFLIVLQEGEDGRRFRFRFAGLNQCGFRVRFPLELVDMNRWGIDREGAFLKPRVSGERVALAKVDRMELTVYRKSPEPVRWAMTDFVATEEDVPLMTDPALPKGPLLDEMGQSTIHDWPAKTRSLEEMSARLRKQHEEAPHQKWPAEFSRWGGWRGRRLMRAPGFFRIHYDGKRWWLVDPDGYAFWSIGLDCVRVDTWAAYTLLEKALAWLPEGDPTYKDAFQSRPSPTVGELKMISYLATNFIRTFGPDGWRERWAAIALAGMRRLRFNTVGNWSEWGFARREQFPYVRPMSFQPKRSRRIYRDFPDVYDPKMIEDAADYASVLEETRDDPAFLGYFLMNEPTWGFSSELPAQGMLYTAPPDCPTRKAFANWLWTKYREDAALSSAWKIEVTFRKVAAGTWREPLPEEARPDLLEFSKRMVTRYFEILTEACRKVDPNHLNLGMRWAGIPPEWAVEGMKSFDVFSMNCYRERVPRDVTDRIHELLKMPVIIGEWHFGALDVGLPASGIGHLKNQADRARAYRVYIEDAAANPNCVGAHWFTLYDESALGRFDGENYQIGFYDVCNRPYEEIGAAAVASHERLYEVAAGKEKPFDDAPEYLPKLF